MSVIAGMEPGLQGWPGVIEDSPRKAEQGGEACGAGAWSKGGEGGCKHREGPAEENPGWEPGLPALTWATAGTRSLHSPLGAHWFRVTRRIRSERPGLTIQGSHVLSAELEQRQEAVASLPVTEPARKARAFPTASWRPGPECLKDGKLPGVGASAFWALEAGRRGMTQGSGHQLAVRP